MDKETIDPAKLVEDHSDYLLSFAMSKLQDIDLAKDLVQDTLFSAIKALDKFKQESSVRTWLTSILNRKIIDHWRKAETRYTDPVSLFFDLDDKKEHWITRKYSNITMETAESKMIREENHNILRECIGLLPKKWRGIVVSKYFEEENTPEICKEFDITASNLWVIIHRTKLLLRDCIQQKNM